MNRFLVLGLMLVFGASMGLFGCAKKLPPADRLELQLKYDVHIVASGETAWRIAKKYEVSLDELIELNELEDASRLKPGQKLLIPGTRRQTLASDPQATKPPPPPPPPAPPPKAPDLSPQPRPSTRSCRQVDTWLDPPKSVTKAGFSWPVDGVVITKYGKQDGLPYEGIDIAAPVGTPVRAAADGEVVFAGTQGGFGRLVVLRHSERRSSVYAHQRALCVKAGQKLRRGELLGLVGQSGGISSPYLYFEVREGAKTVNPRSILPR